MFLHGGLIHIGFNMMSLMQLGPALEELYGSARYFFLYVVTGAFGFLISAAFVTIRWEQAERYWAWWERC